MKRQFTPRRQLGRTRFRATLLGIGDLADRNVPLEKCVATVRRAMDAGLNVIDTAPGYEDGYSEQIVGAALHGRREGMFLIDKIDHADEPVAPQVDASLKNLGVEVVDAFVFHGISEMALWDKLAASGGGMDQLADCVHAGKVRFRGVSSHHPDVVRAAILSGLCDIVMFAVGPFCEPRYVDELVPFALNAVLAQCASRPSALANCSATQKVTAVRCQRDRAGKSVRGVWMPPRRYCRD
jgi:aryl-alcohol dehydrogenase-like predicted oxidoreductase